MRFLELLTRGIIYWKPFRNYLICLNIVKERAGGDDSWLFQWRIHGSEEKMQNRDQFTEYANNKILQAFKDKLDGMNEAETEEHIENFDKVKYSTVYSEMAKITAETIVEDMENSMFERVLENRAELGEFHARQEQKWGKGFVASEAMYFAVQEISENYNAFVVNERNEELKQKYNTFSALKLIHARSCQIYLEIFHLNRLGFADGAFARWRSMYELMIIGYFIKQQGEEIAEKFIEAADTNDRYDWAKTADCFLNTKKKHLTFADIQNQCEFATETWKKQYDLANKVMHASPQGTLYRLGNKQNPNMILIGHSDYGMTLAAEHSAISLSLITCIFLELIPFGDGLVDMQVVDLWVGVIQKYYQETEVECFGNKLKQ